MNAKSPLPVPPPLTRRWAFTPGLRMAVMILALGGFFAGRASAREIDYTGHYELADAKAGRSFSLAVKVTHSRADISFAAAMADGSGAAPDGSGRGRVRDGILSFDFEDSFGNEGTCTLQPVANGYRLSMTIVKVVDISPFHFYGTVVLKKVSDRP